MINEPKSEDVERHPLKPFLPSNAKVLMLGSFPPPKQRWKMDFYYPNFQNDMWRIMGLIFFKDKNHFINIEQKTFKEAEIKSFLNQQGIAIYDVGLEVIREKNNAADQHLKITKTADIASLLRKLPCCNTIITTGDKATQILMQAYGSNAPAPKINQIQNILIEQKQITLFRLPSSSRAYPLALDKKASMYYQCLREIFDAFKT